jgi:hypothetical protein
MSREHAVRPTGHLQVKGKRGNRAFYALVRDADGRDQRKLGPAWFFHALTLGCLLPPARPARCSG